MHKRSRVSGKGSSLSTAAVICIVHHRHPSDTLDETPLPGPACAPTTTRLQLDRPDAVVEAASMTDHGKAITVNAAPPDASHTTVSHSAQTQGVRLSAQDRHVATTSTTRPGNMTATAGCRATPTWASRAVGRVTVSRGRGSGSALPVPLSCSNHARCAMGQDSEHGSVSSQGIMRQLFHTKLLQWAPL